MIEDMSQYGATLNHDEIVIDAARRATHFVIIIHVSRALGRFRVQALTLAEAREIGEIIEAKVGTGRLSMVYAQTEEGNGYFIPRDLDGRINREGKTS